MCGSWCALSRTRCLYLAACLLVVNVHLVIAFGLFCCLLYLFCAFNLSLVWHQKFIVTWKSLRG